MESTTSTQFVSAVEPRKPKIGLQHDDVPSKPPSKSQTRTGLADEHMHVHAHTHKRPHTLRIALLWRRLLVTLFLSTVGHAHDVHTIGFKKTKFEKEKKKKSLILALV